MVGQRADERERSWQWALGRAEVRVGSESDMWGTIGAWRETEEHHADAGEDGPDEGSESTNEKEDCESDDELGAKQSRRSPASSCRRIEW